VLLLVHARPCGSSCHARRSSAARHAHAEPSGGLLRQLGASLLVTTYQAGKLRGLVRDEGDHLNAHFRGFPAPMGMALDGDRLAIGTKTQVWEFVNVPAVAARLDPPAGTTTATCPAPATSRATFRSTRWPGVRNERRGARGKGRRD